MQTNAILSATLLPASSKKSRFSFSNSNNHPAYQKATEKGFGLKWFNFYAKVFIPLMLGITILSFMYILVYHGLVIGSPFRDVAVPLTYTLISLFFYGILTFLLRDFQFFWFNFVYLVFCLVAQLYPSVIVGTLLLFSGHGQALSILNILFRRDISQHILATQIAVWSFVAVNAVFYIGNMVYFFKREFLFSSGE